MYSHGCEKAFDEIFLRHCKGLYRYLNRLVQDRNEAEDILQETFVRVAQNAEKYESTDSFKAWLFRIATNRCLSHLKKRGRLRLLPIPVNFEEQNVETFQSVAGTFQQVFDLELTGAFKKAVVELDPLLRSAVVLRELELYTYPEVAAILDIPIGTVKTNVHRGKKILQRKLARHFREDVLDGLQNN
jgi:RNA polymerase sigma-70 factor (ECF subfamily)